MCHILHCVGIYFLLFLIIASVNKHAVCVCVCVCAGWLTSVWGNVSPVTSLPLHRYECRLSTWPTPPTSTWSPPAPPPDCWTPRRPPENTHAQIHKVTQTVVIELAVVIVALVTSTVLRPMEKQLFMFTVHLNLPAFSDKRFQLSEPNQMTFTILFISFTTTATTQPWALRLGFTWATTEPF